MLEVRLTHSAIIITQRCTLKCKKCVAYSPYYVNKAYYTYEEICRNIDAYFKVVDFVDKFTITGGEPLLHKDLPRIIEKLMEYKTQYRKVEIFTNATLFFSEEMQQVIEKNKEYLTFWVDHYGELSKQFDNLVSYLKEKGVDHVTKKYYGEDAFAGGWVDFGDYTQKAFTEEEIKERFNKCHYPKVQFNFGMWEGEMFPCARTHRLMELGVIPKNPKEYVDLYDETKTVEEKKQTIIDILNTDILTTCAYCNGLCKDSERFMPAEQLTTEELQYIKAGARNCHEVDEMKRNAENEGK